MFNCHGAIFFFWRADSEWSECNFSFDTVLTCAKNAFEDNSFCRVSFSFKGLEWGRPVVLHIAKCTYYEGANCIFLTYQERGSLELAARLLILRVRFLRVHARGDSRSYPWYLRCTLLIKEPPLRDTRGSLRAAKRCVEMSHCVLYMGNDINDRTINSALIHFWQ